MRPKAELIQLGGNVIDISFIPSGIAMDMMGLQDEINKMIDTPEKLERLRKGEAETDARRTFDLSAELCAKITSCQFPEMDKAWLLKNTSVGQLKVLMDRVTRAVYRSLETAEDEELKKQLADEKKNP